MSISDENPAREKDLDALFEKAIDGGLADGELSELERRFFESAEARARYVDFLEIHAGLAAESAGLPRLLAEEPAAAGETRSRDSERRTASPARTAMAVIAGFGLAAALAIGLGWFLLGRGESGGGAAIATLVEAEGCRWAGSELPTIEGASLRPGTLNLVEGLATLRFESGAVVSLEAPVSLEVVSPMVCRLVSGSVVADVPESAHGFTIETPDMQVIDHGTRFGVTASALGQSQVFVFEGLVEVDAGAGGEPRKLAQGQSIRLNPKSDAVEQEPARGIGAAVQALGGDGWTVIPTSLGQGKDSFVRHDGGKEPHGREPLVMVKHTDLAEGNQRKGYFGFDLAMLGAGKRIEEAQFALDVESSGLGFLAMVPDSRFAVYGLRDGEEDAWDEGTLVWETAPANTGEGNTLDPDKVVKLGNFEIRRGAAAEPRMISGEALVEFLNADTNGMATLIVVRETGENEKMGLVHAFASREHPVAMPPTLRLRYR